MFLESEEINLNKRQISILCDDREKSAEAVNLVYVSDGQPGIKRLRNGKGFIYMDGRRRVTGKMFIQRINSLAIPPAWENVWICKDPSGHLQATGIDSRQRKQYRYHPLWNTLRNHTKFYRLHAFGKAIPAIRKNLEKDLGKKGLPRQKVLAAAISLMECTSIRIGNNLYEKMYGSFGLTTLKDKHVKISGPDIRILFRGKKGITQNLSIRNKKLARIIKQCRDIPGRELFQYINEHREADRIDSGMVNEYIKEISGKDFSAKDFRTWAGTVQAITAFKEIGGWKTQKQMKSNILRALDDVACHLGNTRAVCRKYYVHPLILSLYESGKLEKYFMTFDDNCEPWDLACEEKLLLEILRKESGDLLICGE